MKFKAHAKINLALEIFPKRADGFHDIETIFQSIDLADEIEIEKSKKIELEIYPHDSKIPCDSTNLAYRAADLLCNEFKLSGVKIFLNKKIPSGAGLAGGSTNAAGILVAMNDLFELNLSTQDLQDRGAILGSDVPFCIRGGTQFAQGRGEILTPLKNLPPIDLILIKPRVSISTAWAYKEFDNHVPLEFFRTKKILESIDSGDWKLIVQNFFNRFEEIVQLDEIFELKSKLIELGAINSLMSGSGSTVFGIFDSRSKAENAFNSLKNLDAEIFLTRTI
ncbi:MAG: 4-(cytidine 5'-diphospho)-2-C-methyl-D-erythritol kinase [Selenomonadaceae bacterium]|nr:4-(cytidine 5'-diphospho)-2-C-methyl-D-erythritol kinase [Selenomonadaceae bacterium]